MITITFICQKTIAMIIIYFVPKKKKIPVNAWQDVFRRHDHYWNCSKSGWFLLQI